MTGRAGRKYNKRITEFEIDVKTDKGGHYNEGNRNRQGTCSYRTLFTGS